MKKSSKEIVVARPTGQIVLAVLVFAGFVIGDLWLIVKSGSLLAGCLLAPPMIAAFFFALYSCRWRIIFTSKEIRCRGMFSGKNYTYLQLQEVMQYLSYPEGEVVRLTFQDGKRTCFSSGCRNYSKGKKTLAAHHSIRTATK